MLSAPDALSALMLSALMLSALMLLAAQYLYLLCVMVADALLLLAHYPYQPVGVLRTLTFGMVMIFHTY